MSGRHNGTGMVHGKGKRKSGIQRMTTTPVKRTSTAGLPQAVRIESTPMSTKNQRQFLRLYKSTLASKVSDSIAQVAETSRYGILVPVATRNPSIPDNYVEQPIIDLPEKIVKRRRETSWRVKVVDHRVVNENDYRPVTNLEHRALSNVGAAKKMATNDRSSLARFKARTPWTPSPRPPSRSRTRSIFGPVARKIGDGFTYARKESRWNLPTAKKASDYARKGSHWNFPTAQKASGSDYTTARKQSLRSYPEVKQASAGGHTTARKPFPARSTVTRQETRSGSFRRSVLQQRGLTIRPPDEISEFEYFDDGHANRTGTPPPVELPQLQDSHPSDELVSAFEQLSLRENIASAQTVGSSSFQSTFLRRNIRTALVRLAEGRMTNHSLAPRTLAMPRPSYALENVLEEESTVSSSRRARSLVILLHEFVVQTTQNPTTCFIEAQFEFKSTSDVASVVRLDLGRYEVRLPEPQQHNQSQSVFKFNPAIRFTSEPAIFSTAVPDPYTVHDSRVVVSLSHFRDSDGRSISWKHNNPSISINQTLASNKAEFFIAAVGREGRFAPVGRRTTPVTWLRQRRGQGPADLRLQYSPVALYELQWAFDTKRKVQRMTRLSHDSDLAEDQRVIVEYIHNTWSDQDATESTTHSWSTESTGWHCPLCDVFGRFKKASHLRYHLEYHHRDIAASIDDEDVPYKITIRTMTSRDMQGSSDEGEQAALERESTGYSAPYIRAPTNDDFALLTTEQDVQEWLQGGDDDSQIDIIDLVSDDNESESINPRDEDDIPQSPSVEELASETATPVPTFVSIAGAPHSPTAMVKHAMADQSIIDLTQSEDMDDIKPLQHVPLQSTQTSTNSNRDLFRSSGSAFTVLGDLPLEEFGNQANHVLTSEAEIFSRDGMLDEDKIMASLWKRWIMLNRSAFIVNQLAGFRSFINDYYPAIHQAAGWRAWAAQVMVKFRYLPQKEVMAMMRLYKSLIEPMSSQEE